MGGHIALDYAARHPHVWGLVAIEVSFGAASRERRKTRLALSLRRSYATRDEAIARYRLMPSTPGVSERVREALAEHSIREQPDGRFVYKFDPRWFGLTPSPHERLEDVRCPALVIRGDHSTLLTREGAESVVAKLPSARLIEISGAGHNVHLERPIEVIVAITEHLSAHARPPETAAEITAQSEERTG
jgi:pimeloyl-ACP methyl ester carboxylesterase